MKVSRRQEKKGENISCENAPGERLVIQHTENIDLWKMILISPALFVIRNKSLNRKLTIKEL
jgi:hypothetical protein